MIDVDGTLCSAIAPRQPVAVFRQRVLAGFAWPIPAAQAALKIRPACDRVVVCTCRPESLRAATVGWLSRHFGWLSKEPLMMRLDRDARRSDFIRAEQVARARQGHRVVLVDDKPAGLVPGDLGLSPSSWGQLAALLEAR